MQRRLLIPLAATLAALAFVPQRLSAGEPVTATSWEVRKDAQELLEDLAKRGGDEGGLLERVQAMLASQGDSMVAYRQGSAPLSEVLAAQLEEHGLAAAFVRTYEGLAARRLAEVDALAGAPAGVGAADALVDPRAIDRQLGVIGRAYPGTAAARQAWRRLADRAWDAGRVGLYLSYAGRAGEAADAQRRARVEAALGLIGGDEPVELPPDLNGLGQMWDIALEALPVQPRLRDTGNFKPVERRLMLSTPTAEVTAASDGMRFFVFDHLVGRIQGRVNSLGSLPLTPRQSRPAVTREGFIAIGLVDGQQVALRCLDRLGEQRWQQRIPAEFNPGVSAPVVFDGLVAYALMVQTEQSADLRVQAFDAASGRPAWDTLIAKVPIARRIMFNSDEIGVAPPALCLHAGGLVALSNSGVLAKVSAGGEVQRIWTYPSISDEMPLAGSRAQRSGAALSDGRTAVATPADNGGMTLVLGPDDAEPRIYRGNGADGEVVDVARGLALIAGRHVVLLDAATLRQRWTALVPNLDNPQGTIGTDRVLVTSTATGAMRLLDPQTGAVSGFDRGMSNASSVASAQQILLVSHGGHTPGRDHITAFAGQGLLERLVAEAGLRPADFRPMVTLASLYEARGESDRALDAYVQALARGAPADYAEKAARITRARIDLAIGDAKRFPALLERHAQLVAGDPALRGEIDYWRARHGEATGASAAASAGYAAVLAGAGRRVPLRDGLEVHLHALAEAGLARLDPGRAPAWMAGRAADQAPAAVAAATAWSAPGQRTRSTIAAGGLAIGYADGVLVANRLGDGGEAWWRVPVRPMLGVSTNVIGEIEGEGMPVQIVEGSSAARAGMRSGDLLAEFNGRRIGNFQRDLREQVLGAKVRAPFTAVVVRGGERLTLNGALGGELVEPLAANRRTVLVRMLMAQAAQQSNQLFVLDLASGEQLWSHEIPPVTQTEEDPPNALLTSDDMVVVQDGQDLAGYPAHGTAEAPGKDKPRWRLSGFAAALPRARLINDRLLWLPDQGRGVAHLVEAASGRTLAVLPADSPSAPSIAGADCVVLGGDGRLSCWDLGHGRLRWRGQTACAAILALGADAILAINDQTQVTVIDRSSGRVRRTLGEWTGVQERRGPDGAARTGDRTLLVARRGGQQVLLCLGLPGGEVQWETHIPASVDVAQAFVAPGGAWCALSDGGDATAMLRLGAKGAIERLYRVGGADAARTFLPLADGVVVALPDGLRVLASDLPVAPAPVACTAASPGADLAAVARATVGNLAWQPCGDGHYALARAQGSLLVFARPGAKRLLVRVGDTGPALDRLAQAVLFGDAKPRFNDQPDAWRMSDHAHFAGDGAAPAVTVARLEPPADRAPGLPLQIRAATLGDDGAESASDAAAAPWWLRRGWRPVSGF